MMSASTAILYDAFTNLCEKFEEVLSIAQNHAKTSVEEFGSKNFVSVLQLINLYAKFFKIIGVTSRDEFDELIKQNYSYVQIRDAADHLYDVEAEYDEFLNSLDKALLLSSSLTKLNIGDILPEKIPITDVQSKEELDLKEDEIEARGHQVVILSFGAIEGAEMWYNEVKCQFKMYTNPTREIYQVFGLPRTFKTLNLKSLIWYAEQVAGDRQLLKPYEGIKDDTFQLGGDFIVDHTSKVTFVYRSKTPPDRPTIDQILQAMGPKKQ